MSAVPDTRPLSFPAAFDDGGVRHRIGLIELATAETAELDFRRMLPDDAAFYTSRVLNENPVTIENLRGQRDKLADAAAQLLPGAPLDVVCYSCTSGTVANGFDVIEAEIRRARPGVPVVTPITAALHAFDALGVRRISILTPYTADVNAAMAGYLTERGIEVVGIASFLLESDLDMARLTPDAIRRAALEACAPEAEALFVSCTAIRAVQVLDAVEQELGRPVVSSIQAMAWDCLRTAGFDGSIPGYGRLLREHLSPAADAPAA